MRYARVESEPTVRDFRNTPRIRSAGSSTGLEYTPELRRSTMKTALEATAVANAQEDDAAREAAEIDLEQEKQIEDAQDIIAEETDAHKGVDEDSVLFQILETLNKQSRPNKVMKEAMAIISSSLETDSEYHRLRDIIEDDLKSDPDFLQDILDNESAKQADIESEVRYCIDWRSEGDDTRQLVRHHEGVSTIIANFVGNSTRFANVGTVLRKMNEMGFCEADIYDATNDPENIEEWGERVDMNGVVRQSVRIGPQWGFIDGDGNMVIEVEFVDAEAYNAETCKTRVLYRTKRTQVTGDWYEVDHVGGARKLVESGLKIGELPEVKVEEVEEEVKAEVEEVEETEDK